MASEFCWLAEIPSTGRLGPLYLHAARGPGVCGFTYDAGDAQRFPDRAAAQAEIDALNGALGAQPVEHGFG